MIQVFLKSQIYCFAFYLILLLSCSDQLSETRSPESALITTENLNKHNAPRVDSILQFNVMVTSIFEDSKGNFWFGSHGDGLCRYDGKQFTYFTANHGLPSGIVREIAPGPDWSKTRKINGGNQISSIQEDKDGIIWIKTSEDICKFDGQTFSAVTPDGSSVLSMNKSDQEWKTELDYLWFSSWSKLGLYRYNGNQLEFISFPFPYDSKRDGVSEFYKDNEGTIWLGTMENGTFRYDGKSFTRINKDDEIGICRSVFQDKTGRIWITNNLYGLYYLEGGVLTDFIKEYSKTKNDDQIVKEFKTGFQSIEQDEDGDIWFGTFGNGLWRYNGDQLTHFAKSDSFPIVTAKSIYKDKKGKLWFGLGEGSVYGFNGKSFDRFDEIITNK